MSRLRISYRLSLAVALPAFVITVGGLLLWRSYVVGNRTVDELTTTLFREVARSTGQRTRNHLRDASIAAETLAHLDRERSSAETDPRLLTDLEAVLRVHPGFAWVGYGDEAGAFAGVTRPAPGKLRLNRSHLVADPKEPTKHHTETVEDDLDDAGGRTPFRTRDDMGYDPRQRPWYTLAKTQNKTVWLHPYRFTGSQALGITVATPQRHPKGGIAGVYTVDIELEALSKFISELKLSEHGEIFLYAEDGTILAHPRFAALVRKGEADLPDLRSQGGAFLAFDDARRKGDRHGLEFKVAGTRWLGRASRATEDKEGPQWFVGVIAPAADFHGALARAGRDSIVTGAIALLFAVLIAWWLATRIATPLLRLSEQMERIGRFELEGDESRRSVFSEIATMQDRLANMRGSLSSFARFVPRDLVRRLVASGHEARLGGELRDMTIFFSDISGFTTFAEKLAPDQLVAYLGGYLEAMTHTITDGGGTVDKYLGDGILAFWGAPAEDHEHAMRAARTALVCQRRLRELAAAPGSAWIAETKTRIGLATGRVLVGNVGTPERLNYTVMGDIANLASRLESLSKQYGTVLLVSATTYEAARGGVVARPIDVVAVKGKEEGIRVYELLTLTDADDAPAMKALATACEAALGKYLARDFAGAEAAWRAILSTRPDDTAARVMADRAARFASTPPPPDWDGVYEAESK